ncbi:hypothetical protein ES703_48605 [subsurface metagenome]
MGPPAINRKMGTLKYLSEQDVEPIMSSDRYSILSAGGLMADSGYSMLSTGRPMAVESGIWSWNFSSP